MTVAPRELISHGWNRLVKSPFIARPSNTKLPREKRSRVACTLQYDADCRRVRSVCCHSCSGITGRPSKLTFLDNRLQTVQRENQRPDPSWKKQVRTVRKYMCNVYMSLDPFFLCIRAIPDFLGSWHDVFFINFSRNYDSRNYDPSSTFYVVYQEL